MSQFTAYDTRRLTRASFELTPSGRRQARALLLAVLAVVLAIAIAGKAGLIDASQAAPLRYAEAEREVSRLTAELERASTELAMERATRAELQRQADELSARVAELTQQMEFVTSRARGNR